MSRRKRRRWLSDARIKQIKGMASFYRSSGITDPKVIASKLECPTKVIVDLLR